MSMWSNLRNSKEAINLVCTLNIAGFHLDSGIEKVPGVDTVCFLVFAKYRDNILLEFTKDNINILQRR